MNASGSGDFDDDLNWYFTKPINISKQAVKTTTVPKTKPSPQKPIQRPIFHSGSSNPSYINDSSRKNLFDVPIENVFEALGIIRPHGTLSLRDEIKIARGEKSHPSTNTPKTYRQKLYPNAPIQHIVDEYDEADFGDTYDNYTPAKLKIGIKHPDPVVESNSLSVVSPPDITYKLKFPPELIEGCLLSSLQLESVVYACQKHLDFLPNKSRAGYLIGDGPGVGKGRIISGIIFENMLNSRTKALWISVSSDLRYDAQNDLEDIGCDVTVISLHKLNYNDRIEEHFDEYNNVGVLFSTYASLIGESHSSDTYFTSRYNQILDWLGADFDGAIVFDECHKAKNLKPTGNAKPTKTALTVLKLQSDLPKARIVYCSATGASEPRNMAYMTRLGLWGLGTPFFDFDSFLSSVEKRGVGAMELVAIDMKQRGVYLARQLSFTGVSFKVLENPLSAAFIDVYNKCVIFWDKSYDYFEKASNLIDYSSRDKSFMLANFYSSHQRFFKALCIASKVESVVKIVRQGLSENKAVVIGLQSTGEAVSVRLVKQNRYTKIVSTVYGILLNLVTKQFPLFDRKTGDSKKKIDGDESFSSDSDNLNHTLGTKRKKPALDDDNSLLSSLFQSSTIDWSSYTRGNTQIGSNIKKAKNDALELCEQMAKELYNDVQNLEPILPANTLDELIDKLGGIDFVAEMTGRKGRFVRSSVNDYVYQSRSNEETSLELVNVHERDNFMQGKKLIAIISEAASSGISLQSDRRVTNTRKRLHITLELSWSADRAIQQFGRTHRSNQVSPPEYLFIISELAGEKRFACVVAKRLESLGALTHGDRRAAETRDLSQFNIDTKYGRYALDKMNDILHSGKPNLVSIPKYDGDFIEDARNISSKLFKSEYSRGSDSKGGESNPKIHKFLNRLLGVKVDLQNAIYEFYTNILDHCIKEAKLSGKFDFGIVDFGIAGDTIEENTKSVFEMKSSSGVTSVELITFNIERGLSFATAKAYVERSDDPNVGFYMSKEPKGRFRQCILILKNSACKNEEKAYTCSHPNTGLGTKTDFIENLTKNFHRVSPTVVQDEWTRFYENSLHVCVHKYFHGVCKVEENLGQCEFGLRTRPIHLLCGAIFSMWNIIEETFESSPIRMARVLTKEKARRIGILIPTSYIPRLKNTFQKKSTVQ